MSAEFALIMLLIIPALAAALIPLCGRAPNLREAVTLGAGNGGKDGAEWF